MGFSGRGGREVVETMKCLALVDRVTLRYLVLADVTCVIMWLSPMEIGEIRGDESGIGD